MSYEVQEKLINQAGENGYNAALNDFFDEIKKLQVDGYLLTRENIFEIWERLLQKKYIALKKND